MRQLESLHKQGERKEFYKIVNNITKIKRGSYLVKAVQKGGWTSSTDEERDEAIANYMRELYQGQPADYKEACENRTTIFSVSDVEEAIKGTNSNKAIGPDMFDGSILLKNDVLRGRVAGEIMEMLNKGEFPEYFQEGRLTALSKREGKITVELEDIRPIVIRSHLTKITEKADLTRLKEKHGHLIKTALSQTGFKPEHGTASNIAKMLTLKLSEKSGL